MFRTLVGGLLDLLAPPECPGCALTWQRGATRRPPTSVERRDRGAGAHGLAGARGRANECGPGAPDLEEPPNGVYALFCPACAPLIESAAANLRPPARTAAVHGFHGPLADAIRRFKYGGASHLAADLGALLGEGASAYGGRVDAVVPMPLHIRKLRARGFNPSLLLGRPLAASLNVPVRAGWLTRRRPTRSQAGLTSDQRKLNVRGAFAAGSAPPQRILLVDDVRTTGATLAEAAATLRALGHDVFALALAQAPA